MNLSLWMAKQSFQSSRQTFYEDLAEALEDEDKLTRRIDVLAERAVAERDVLAPLYQLWSRRMDDRQFTEALEGTVPQGDLMILGASEGAGKLADGLKFASLVIGASKEMKSSLYGAVIGFVFLGAFLCVLLALFSFYGIGLIETLVPPDQWPWVGQLLRDMARFVTGWGVQVLCAFFIGGTAYLWSLPRLRGRFRVGLDRYVPFYTIYRDFQGALFLVSLAALMRNEVSLNRALETLEATASPWLRWHIREILFRLDYESDQPGKAFATGIFDKRLTWRIIDFSERSTFAKAIEKVGIRSIDGVTKMVSKSAGTINKALMILSGGLLAFIIAGAFLTLYEAQNAVQRQMSATGSLK
jgi:type II secretory pathway component PulF